MSSHKAMKKRERKPPAIKKPMMTMNRGSPSGVCRKSIACLLFANQLSGIGVDFVSNGESRYQRIGSMKP